MSPQFFVTKGHFRLALAFILGASGGFAQYAYVSSPTGIAVVNASTGQPVASMPMVGSPSGLALAPGGQYLYLAESSANCVAVIDTTSNSVVATIPVGKMPVRVAVTPNGQAVYVANAESNSVSAISTATNTVLATIPVGSAPESLAATPDSSLVFVANSYSGNISVISTASNTVVGKWKTALGANTVAVSPDGSTLYVTNSLTNQLALYNTTSGDLLRTISGFSHPDSILISALGYAYVANATGGSVSIVSTTSLAIVATVRVGAVPIATAMSPDGSEVYIANRNANSLSVISTDTNSVVRTIANLASPLSVAVTAAASAAPNLCAAAATGLPDFPGTLPTLPRSCYQPQYPTPTSTINVSTAAELQGALQTGPCGKQIVLQPGTNYVITDQRVGLGNTPSNIGWQTSSSFPLGSQIVDPAHHVQGVTAAGLSGTVYPSFNDAGGLTADGTATWTDEGLSPTYCPTNPILVVSSTISTATPAYSVPSKSLAGTEAIPTLSCNTPGCTVLAVQDGASGFYFAGFEITLGPAATNVYPLVLSGNMTYNPATLPSYITFDRMLVHPNSVVGSDCWTNYPLPENHCIADGVIINGADNTVMYSAVYDIVNTGQDTQAVAVDNGGGPYLIAANDLEASGENLFTYTNCNQIVSNGPPVLYGYIWPWGSPSCPVPSDVTIRLNHIQKQTAWEQTATGVSCISNPVAGCLDVKNLLEIKGGNRVLIDANILETVWVEGQQGEGFINNCGSNIAYPVMECNDITIQNNVFGHMATVAQFGGWGTVYWAPGTQYYSTSNGQFPPATAGIEPTALLDLNGHIQNQTVASCVSGASLPVFNTSGGAATDGTCSWVDQGLSPTGQRLLFRNNLAYDINGLTWGGNAGLSGFAFSALGTNYLRLDHDTLVNMGSTPYTEYFGAYFNGGPQFVQNFQMTNSIMFGQISPLAGESVALMPGTQTWGATVLVGDYWPNAAPGNVKTPPYPAGIETLTSTTNNCQYANYTESVCWPLDWALVGFSDFTGANAGTDLPGLELAPASPYKGQGTDGLDPGADVAAVLAAVAPITW